MFRSTGSGSFNFRSSRKVGLINKYLFFLYVNENIYILGWKFHQKRK